MQQLRRVLHEDGAALRVPRLAPEPAEKLRNELVGGRVESERVVERSGAADELRESLLQLDQGIRAVRAEIANGALRAGAAAFPCLPQAVLRPDEKREAPRGGVEDRHRVRLEKARQVNEVGIGAVPVGDVIPERRLLRAEEDGDTLSHRVEKARAAAGVDVVPA